MSGVRLRTTCITTCPSFFVLHVPNPNPEATLSPWVPREAICADDRRNCLALRKHAGSLEWPLHSHEQRRLDVTRVYCVVLWDAPRTGSLCACAWTCPCKQDAGQRSPRQRTRVVVIGEHQRINADDAHSHAREMIKQIRLHSVKRLLLFLVSRTFLQHRNVLFL